MLVTGSGQSRISLELLCAMEGGWAEPWEGVQGEAVPALPCTAALPCGSLEAKGRARKGWFIPSGFPKEPGRIWGRDQHSLQLCQNGSLTWFKPGGAAECKYLMAPQLPLVNLLQLSPAKLFLKFTGDVWSSPFSWRLLSWVCAEPPSAGRAGFWSCPSSGKGGRERGISSQLSPCCHSPWGCSFFGQGGHPSASPEVLHQHGGWQHLNG